MNRSPNWTLIAGPAIVIGVLQGAWRLRRIRRQKLGHR